MKKRPNIFLLLSYEHSFRFMGHVPTSEGGEPIETPTLDHLASQADEVVCHESIAFLREHQHANPDKPWFLCASFSRPHFPLTAPRRHLAKFLTDNVTEPAPDRPIVCDSLTPRWGEGTEFRMVRQDRYKYVRFRKAPSLAFDLQADPGEQHNLLQQEAELPAPLQALAMFADESMDFDAAENERTERDGNLQIQYAHNALASTGNLYVMPSGEVVNAEDTLYAPTTIATSLNDMLGDDWDQQNRNQPGTGGDAWDRA